MKKALVIGVNQYSPQKPLRGCVNDAKAINSLLREVYSFDETTLLIDQSVTKTTILDSLTTLLEPIPNELDGVRVFFFAGHGGRVLDVSGDEVDKIDENLCMPDYDWSNTSTYILDDDLARVLEKGAQASPAIRLYVLLDSCHSGTGTRDVPSTLTWQDIDAVSKSILNASTPAAAGLGSDDPRLSLLCVSRVASDPLEVTVLLKNADSTLESKYLSLGFSSINNQPDSHLLLSGCTANQTCKDVPLDGDYHGIFTYTLTKLARANPAITWSDLQVSIMGIIAEPFNQNPQLEGASALKALPIFS